MFEFPPPRQRGLLLHGFLIVVLLAVLVIALWQVFQVSVGPSFTIYVVLALGSFIGLPFLGYRAYALWKARYPLDRDNLQERRNNGMHWTALRSAPDAERYVRN